MTINIFWDSEASVWVAIAESQGLAVDADTFEDLVLKLRDIVPDLIELNK